MSIRPPAGRPCAQTFQISMFRQSFLSEHSKHKAASPLRINVAMETHHFSEEHHLPIGMIAESCEIFMDII